MFRLTYIDPVFDVDGTLTFSRGKIDMDFGVFFTNSSCL